MPAQRGQPRNSATPPRHGNISARSSNRLAMRATPALWSPMRMRTLMGTENARQKVRIAAAAILPVALILLAPPARAESLEVLGYSGHLGEWELSATLKEDDSTAAREYSGPLSMKHVGLCTQDGPEEKTGKIHLQMSSSSSRLQATLWLDGVECGYQGALSEFYSGTMNCPGREAVPLKLWIKQAK
jgi:hypothetical protein